MKKRMISQKNETETGAGAKTALITGITDQDGSYLAEPSA